MDLKNSKGRKRKEKEKIEGILFGKKFWLIRFCHLITPKANFI